MAKKKDGLYLVDGSSYIHRAYHAMPGLSNSKGLPTGAVFVFTNMLEKTLRERNPDRIAVVYDPGGPNFRHRLYDKYKANRPPLPDDFRTQIPYIHRIVDAYGLPTITVPGFEADDVIAGLTHIASAQGVEVVIVSGDKDLMQLVADGVTMWDPQKDALYDVDAVMKKFGASPLMLRDFFALTGDSSDNIPGVPGIGPKTAATLMEKFGGLDALYEHIDQVTQKKVKENLLAHKDNAFLSRELVTLKIDAPLDCGIDTLILGERKTDELRELFQDLEFKKLLGELPPRRNLSYSGYCMISTLAELNDWVEALRNAGRFAVDLETTSEEPMRADLVGISLCAEAGKACYIPVGHTCVGQLDKAAVSAILGPLLEDDRIKKIGQNIKYDMIVLQNEGVRLKGVECDTMLASYLLDPNRRGHSLDDLAQNWLDHRTIRIKELIGSGKSQILFSEVDLKNAVDYACEDADVTFRVAEILSPRLEEQNLMELFRTVEIPLVSVLVHMETAGVKIDTDYLTEVSREFGSALDFIEADIYLSAGRPFNINSPKQLAEILFTELGLKGVKKTKTGLSTSLEVLEELALEHDLPRRILDYRSLYKLKTTYADALITLVNPRTGRIHTSYNQAVAATGRLSSSDPNLQNIPIRTAEGRKIRRAFIPEDGYLFVAADYSQVELRVMAHVSGDARLKEAFHMGEDIHAVTAAQVFNVPIDMVTPEMRRRAKEINFGIMYGMGAFRLASRLGVGQKMAKQYLQDYYETYAGVHRYMEETPEKAKECGYVTTLLGRRRPTPDLNSSNKQAQQGAKRVAINTTIQGSAADLMKLAMIRVHAALEKRKLPVKMILQVHDELALEAREDAAEEAAALLKHEMEQVYPLSVPLLVDAHTGKNWDEVH